MRYRLLGNSGLRVSEACLGIKVFEAFLEAGGNFVSRIEPGFPSNLYANPFAQSLRYGGMRDRLLIPSEI